MKKCICRIFICIILIFLGVGLFPLKFAVKIPDSNKNYILVKMDTATLSPWTCIGGNIDKLNNTDSVWLTGNVPKKLSYYVLRCDNTYICYGYYNGIKVSDAGTCDQFYVNNWDILYPIKRDSIFPLPKKFLCNFDKK